VREVTIHLAPGETDRELERALLALDPAAQVHRVTGRHGRTGVRVCAHLALRYLSAVDTLERAELVTEGAVATVEAPAPAEPAPPVAEEPKAKPEAKKAAPAKKAAAKKAAPAAPEKPEEV
jgi:hypothetical protein